jgi:hypothetical protein
MTMTLRIQLHQIGDGPLEADQHRQAAPQRRQTSSSITCGIPPIDSEAAPEAGECNLRRRHARLGHQVDKRGNDLRLKPYQRIEDHVGKCGSHILVPSVT